MLPAQQCFDTGDRRARQLELGLVMQEELVALQGLLQARLQRQTLERLSLHFLGVEVKIVLPFFLGGVHGNIGVPHQTLFVLRVGRKQADADAGCHPALLPHDDDRPHQNREQLTCNEGDLLGRTDLLRQHDELIAAQTRHRVARAHALLDALSHLLEQRVACFVPERVVDDLETVEVDEQHGKLAAVTPRRLEGHIQHLAERHAVGQAGQAIVIGQVFDAQRREMALGLAFKVVECVGDVLRHALEQSEDLIVEHVGLVVVDQQHANAVTASDERQRGRRATARLPCDVVPRCGTFVKKKVIADAGLPAAKREAYQSAPFGQRLIKREVQASMQVRSPARGGHRTQPIGALVDQENRGVGEFPAMHGSLADLLIQSVGRLGMQDGMVRLAERGKHSSESQGRLLQVLALQELAELAADHANGLQQPLVRFPEYAAVENEHADRLALRGDRNRQCATHVCVARECGARDAGVVAHVGHPQRLARLPNLTDHAGAWTVGHAARHLDVALDAHVGDAPGLAEAQHAGRRVDTKVASALPAQRFADVAKDAFEYFLNALHFI